MNRLEALRAQLATINAQLRATPRTAQNAQYCQQLQNQASQIQLQITALMNQQGAQTHQHKPVNKIPVKGRDVHAVAFAENANQTGHITVDGLAHIISRDMPSLFEAFVHNNPAGVNHYLLNTLGFKSLGSHPALKDIFGQMRILLANAQRTGDYSILKNMLTRVPFNKNARNYTVVPALWNTLGVPYGAFNVVLAKYYNV